MLYKFLFPSKPDGAATSAILLIVRIIFGVLLMNHGIEKWSNYQELSAVFPDPLGVGSPLSLGLAIFGELACSMAFIIGFLYRLAMLPMIFTMGMAFFCYSRKRSVCGQRTGFHISGGIRTDVYYRSWKVCRRPLAG